MGSENIRVGAGRVIYKGYDLGLTQGGVEISMESDTYTVSADQFGDLEVASFISNRNITVTAPLLETTFDNMIRTMPGAKLVTDPTDPTRKRVDVQTGIGTSLIEQSGELIVRSQANDILIPKVLNEDFIAPLAGTAGGLSFNYAHDSERLLNVEFKVYPNPISQKLFSFGHPDAGAPLFTAPDPAALTPEVNTGDTYAVTWDANGNADHANYRVVAGTIHGSTNYYDSGVLTAATLSDTVTGLPEDGSEVAITLFYLQNGFWNSRALNIISN